MFRHSDPWTRIAARFTITNDEGNDLQPGLDHAEIPVRGIRSGGCINLFVGNVPFHMPVYLEYSPWLILFVFADLIQVNDPQVWSLQDGVRGKCAGVQ